MTTVRLEDPRYFQIVVLSLLLGYGLVALDFGIHWQNAAAIVVTAQIVQFVASRFTGSRRFDPRSAIITSLSLTLLLRTGEMPLAALAACIAISSKFLIRIGDKHVFNPANLALVTVMLASDRAWVATGQWGSAAVGAVAVACLGCIVLTRAKRAETTLSFLAAYSFAVFARALWLGDPLQIPLHQLQNGALLVFAFFMISDPKTTPDSAFNRWLYGALVAGLTVMIQFVFYAPAAPILALVVTAPLVPLLDALGGGRAYRWDAPAERSLPTTKGAS